MSDRTDAATRDPSAPEPEPDAELDRRRRTRDAARRQRFDRWSHCWCRRLHRLVRSRVRRRSRRPTVSPPTVTPSDVDVAPPPVDLAPPIDEPPARVGTDPLGRAVRRIFRRPTEWATSDWPTRRIVQVVFTVFSLAVTTAIMMNVVHLNPLSSTRDLVFDDTTPTGGDFGAHVWGPAFLRDYLLPVVAAQRVEHGLVRGHARLPLLHGGAGAARRRPRHRARRTASP